MLEWALYAPGPRALAALARRPASELLAEAWPELFPRELPFARLYYGQELCERLVPSARELCSAAQLAAERGWGLSVVTSAPSDAALDAWGAPLAGFELQTEGLELVVNELGLLRRLAGSASLVVGRQLKRMLKDPRLPGYVPRLAWPAEELALWRRHGVSRVEVDLTPSGLPWVGDAPLPVSAYLPCGITATGRVCVSGSLRLPSADKFRPNPRCARDCRDHTFVLEVPGATSRLLSKGNTSFFVPPRELLREQLGALEAQGYSRAVVQLGLPIEG